MTFSARYLGLYGTFLGAGGSLTINSTVSALGFVIASFDATRLVTFPSYSFGEATGTISLSEYPDTTFIGFVNTTGNVAGSFSDAQDELDVYRFVTGNAGAVPEPASWAMMLVGFGMLGAALRYRRRGTKVAFG